MPAGEGSNFPCSDMNYCLPLTLSGYCEHSCYKRRRRQREVQQTDISFWKRNNFNSNKSRSRRSLLSYHQFCTAVAFLTILLIFPGANCLRCLQCIESVNSLDLPIPKHQLRLTTGLSQPRCPVEVEIYCDEGRDVCVSQSTQADNGDWWIMKGCDYSYLYDRHGCLNMKVFRSKTSLHLMRTVNEAQADQWVCICDRNNCNGAAGSRIGPRPGTGSGLGSGFGWSRLWMYSIAAAIACMSSTLAKLTVL